MAAVEFALVASVFFMMLFGALEFSRLLWTWNAASEATRYGARLAAVCDRTASDVTFIKTRMRTRLGSLSDSHISITYQPAGCNATTTPPICQSVTVATTGVRFQTLIPFAPVAASMPEFSTTLSRESMVSTGNPVCN